MFIVGTAILLGGSAIFSTFMQSSIFSDYSQYSSTSNAAAGSMLMLKFIIFSVFLTLNNYGQFHKISLLKTIHSNVISRDYYASDRFVVG